MMSENNNEFNYTYSSKQQEEIKKIRQKYEAPTENKMERLVKLDKKASQKAQAVGITLGVIGTLLLGLGMSLIMSDLSDHLGIDGIVAAISGIIIGLLGGVIAVSAYPLYNICLKKQRKKIASEIIRLSNELLK